MSQPGLDLTELPVLDDTVDELENLRRIEDRWGTVDARTLATVVVNDPLMTLRVLAESAHQRSAHQSSDTATITAAVLIMGTSRFFELASRLHRVSERLPDGSAGAMALDRALTQARRAATFAAAIALERQDGEAERMQEAALLLDAAAWIDLLDHPECAGAPDTPFWTDPTHDPCPGATLNRVRQGHLPERLLPLIDAQAERAALFEPQRRVVLWSRELAWCTANGWPELDLTAVEAPAFDAPDPELELPPQERSVPSDPASRHYHQRVLPTLSLLMNRSPVATDHFLRAIDD